MKVSVKNIEKLQVTIAWEKVENASEYAVFWADYDSETMVYEKRYTGTELEFTLNKSTHVPHYFYVEAYENGKLLEKRIQIYI